jgi:hypothetical protein
MPETTSLSSQQRLSEVTRYAYGILLLTSVHHAYGAYIYATPWRLHVVALSLAAAAAIGVAAGVVRTHQAGVAGTIAFWILCAVTLAFPFGMIGFFEGGYNHVLKDVLYFGGVSRDVMRTLFPAPVYEMPNSVFFELTGVAQMVPAVVGGGRLYGLVRHWRRRNSPIRSVSPVGHGEVVSR